MFKKIVGSIDAFKIVVVMQRLIMYGEILLTSRLVIVSFKNFKPEP